MPKIWYRKSKKAYYLQIDRHTQKRLGKTRSEADAAYREWLIEQGTSLPEKEQKRLTIQEVADEFLAHARAHTKPKSHAFYSYFVEPFLERFGAALAAGFSPLAFTKWLDEHEGWKGSRRNAIIAVKRMFNWAVKEAKLLKESPLAGVKRPPKRKRKRILEPTERELLLSKIKDEAFRQFVFAMLETGCRPGEVMAVTANHVSRDCSNWTFDEHKTDNTGEARVVYLTPAMQELTRKLVERHPEGPIFRMYRGKKSAKDKYNRAVLGTKVAWTYNALRCRFKRLRENCPELHGITSYVLRHTFTTQALINGVPVPVVSALLGHKSIKMVDEHYNHTDQVTGQLKEAVKKATARD
jgi:integrase